MSFAALSLTKATSISMRDAGELLGISHQRVQQLVAQGEIKLPTPKKRPKT
jgi:DNA-directed RNA polymerase specialized sigma subunit